MSGLGQYLSGLREERGLSIEEMARVTRVAPRYLQALEREDLTALPAPVFTKGYIRAYCQALGVHADAALGRYPGGAVVAAATPDPVATARASNGRRGRGTLLVSFALLVGFGLALLVVALYLQSGRPEVGKRHAAVPAAGDAAAPTPVADGAPPAARVSSPPPRSTAGSPAVASAPPAAPAAPAVPAPAARAEAKVASTSPAESRPAGEGLPSAVIVSIAPVLRLGSVVSPYRLIARTSEATWLRVRTEDGRTIEETIPPGEVREWISNRPFVLTVGNAGGITLELNGQKLPPLGARGTVVGNLVLPPPAP
jgi:cytoskeleton protein RodZ